MICEPRALEGIGQCHLRDGNLGEGAAPLRQALAIYQRIGAPAARRLQETLRHHSINTARPRAAKALSQPHPPHPENQRMGDPGESLGRLRETSPMWPLIPGVGSPHCCNAAGWMGLAWRSSGSGEHADAGVAPRRGGSRF